MNLLNTAICETKEGDLLIVWGGRRIVTQCLTPPIVEGGGEPGVESVWKRRYRWDNGNMIITRVYDNYTKRKDYVGMFGRNPAIIKDKTGRIWIGCRIPVVSSQDPQGVLSREYVVPKNIGTTAGLNFWKELDGDNLGLLNGAYPFDWQEQVGIPIKTLLSELPEDISDVDQLLAMLGNSEGEVSIGETTMEMFTEWTENFLTGELTLRGRGGNLMDEDNPKRWLWNEDEGLGKEFTSALINDDGQQVRYRIDDKIVLSMGTDWKDLYVLATAGNYGISGNVRVNSFGEIIIAGHKEANGSIPYVAEYRGVVTRKAEQAQQDEWEALWAIDNEREWVYENAKVPAEGYFSWEEPPTPEQQEAITKSLTQYYYALPTLQSQRVGLCVAKSGLVFLSWLHGNQTIVPISEAQKQYKAVGLRMAISTDHGQSFEPLIPERSGFLEGSINE